SPQEARGADRQHHGHGKEDHVGQVAAAGLMQEEEEKEEGGPPQARRLQQAVPGPEGQRDEAHEQHLGMAGLVPAIGGEGEDAAAEERRRRTGPTPPQHIPRPPGAEHERAQEEEVVDRHRGHARKQGGEEGAERGGAEEAVRVGCDAAGREEERQVPEVGHTQPHLMHAPLEDRQYEPGVPGVWSDVVAEHPPDRPQIVERQPEIGERGQGMLDESGNAEAGSGGRFHGRAKSTGSPFCHPRPSGILPPTDMRFRPLHAVCLSFVLLGLAGTIYKIHFPPGPVADEAAYLMITQSLWHDHDLQYDHRDLLRAYEIWDQGPNGLILFTRDGGKTMYYGKPYAYSLAALPFYAVFGVQGLVIFNMAVWLAMLFSAWWFLQDQQGPIGLFLAGFFFASAAFVYVFWMQPEVFNMACLFFPLLLWHWLRKKEAWGAREYWLLAGAGALLAAAFVSKEPTVLLGGPIAVDLLWRRRWKGLVALALPSVLGLIFLLGIQWRMTGTWSPYRGVQRRSFESDYPLESAKDLWQAYRGTSFGSWSGLGVETS